MFCPKCGSTQNDELKFCKNCGTNLSAVRKAVVTGDAGEKFDWSKTWVAEMLQSSEESVRRARELERLQGITPEVKRRREIKAGVITASVGAGAMILLYFLMEGIILSGSVPGPEAEILKRIWIAGVIPLFVGLALIVNGAFVSKLFSGSEIQPPGDMNRALSSNPAGEYLPPADTNELFPAGFSVTDETTRHLEEVPARRSRSAQSDQ